LFGSAARRDWRGIFSSAFGLRPLAFCHLITIAIQQWPGRTTGTFGLPKSGTPIAAERGQRADLGERAGFFLTKCGAVHQIVN
jgi:hypothetical protein